MPFYSEDRCSKCGQLASPERLSVKQVMFFTRTKPRKLVRSRVVAWLCDDCIEVDEDYIAEAYSGPGFKSPSLERVRNDQV